MPRRRCAARGQAIASERCSASQQRGWPPSRVCFHRTGSGPSRGRRRRRAGRRTPGVAIGGGLRSRRPRARSSKSRRADSRRHVPDATIACQHGSSDGHRRRRQRWLRSARAQLGCRRRPRRPRHRCAWPRVPRRAQRRNSSSTDWPPSGQSSKMSTIRVHARRPRPIRITAGRDTLRGAWRRPCGLANANRDRLEQVTARSVTRSAYGPAPSPLASTK